MKFIKDDGGLNGSMLQGYVYIKYDDLVEVFGLPKIVTGDGKVQVEWSGTIDGIPFAIYDWKCYDKNPKTIIEWCIGGFGQKTVNAVKGYLAEHNC
jgi:hypothetical protein